MAWFVLQPKINRARPAEYSSAISKLGPVQTFSPPPVIKKAGVEGIHAGVWLITH
jgi:hypothetical protein